MSHSAMKSPGRQGSSPTKTASYRCDDCGDVSHSQASWSLHRSVCHAAGKSGISDSEEFLEETTEIITKTEQIADACTCPKCGEHFLLLRQNHFQCGLCEFQDTDQSHFFAHLKEHYEPHSVMTVDPGSVIIEQVIDDTNDLYNRNESDKHSDVPAHTEELINQPSLAPDVPDEFDDRDDPEYVPEDDRDEDDSGDEEWEDPDAKKREVVSPTKTPHKDGSAQKKLDYKPIGSRKSDDTKDSKPKMGIVWQEGKGAPKKLSFVKTPSEQVIPRKPSLLKKPSVGKSPPATDIGRPVTIKQEPPDSPPPPTNGTTKWVRLQDIKYVGAPGISPIRRTPWAVPSGPTRAARKVPQKSSAKGSQPSDSSTKGSAENTSEDGEPKKKAPKKSKEPKPPRERKIPVCGICKRVFSSAQALKTHLRIHTGEKDFSCEHCGKAFTQWSTCQQHIMSLHSGIKKFTCEFCGACFARSSSLRVHRRIHTGEVLHHCNICGKGFRAKSYLDRHRTLHTGEKRYKCEFCFKTFRTSTDMKRHRNAIHFQLGNISLTQAREILQTRMDFSRIPRQRPSTTVIQRFVEENSSENSGDEEEEEEEVIRATTVIAGTHYEL